MAVSLQQQQGGAVGPLSDLELARQLQQEEYQQQQQREQQQQQQQGSLQAAQQVTTTSTQLQVTSKSILRKMTWKC